MTKFRKKPVVIEAIQWTGENRVEIARFIRGDDLTDSDQLLLPGNSLFIETLKGTHRADKGDWIIRGVAGEFYPCKPGIFKETYDLVLEGAGR
jgi:hypothetical protein